MNAADNMKNKPRVLHIFDFDDTLVMSDESPIVVTQADGTIISLTGKNWSYYHPQEGDVFDYSNMEYLHNPRPIAGIWTEFKSRLESALEHTHILTARASRTPLDKYFREQEVVVSVNCLAIPPGDNNGHHKAGWIAKKIQEHGYDVVEFFDDRHDCVTEVAALRKSFPNIKFIVWHITDGEMVHVD